MSQRFSPRWLMWAAAALMLLTDQLTKAWVATNLPPNQSVDLIPWLRPVASFTYVTNRGVAFGLLPQLGDVFTIFGILVIGAVLIFQHKLQGEGWPVYLAIGLQMGGAAGNVLDRLLRGQVVDFIDLNFWPMQHWPIFNVADMGIVAGVIVLLLTSFVTERSMQSDTPKAQEELIHENLEA